MAETRKYGQGELLAAIAEVSMDLDVPVEAFLIGGAVMMIQGRKVATNDVDLVLRSDDMMDGGARRAFFVGEGAAAPPHWTRRES